MKLCKSEQCVGCYACVNICSKNAITMEQDYTGAVYPRIDAENCIECGVCQQVCPSLISVAGNDIKKCYAAWSSDDIIAENSASAGLVTTLSNLVIDQGGVVFGTRYEKGTLVFDYAQDKEKIREFQGSKYVHAYIGFMYKKVKEFLSSNKKVLFVGTPCQIAGLKGYLHKDCENLITVDLICHGVAPQKYLQEHMNKVLKHKPYDKVLFRSAYGEKTVAYSNAKPVYVKNKSADLFFSAYAKGIIHRENCYNCPYASLKRMGDITAGDFWGIDKDKLINDASKISYVSLAFVNSSKGQALLQQAQGLLVLEERLIEETLGGNKQLSYPCARHPQRELFLEEYKKSGFNKGIKCTLLYKQVKKADRYSKLSKLFRKIKHLIYK